MPSRLLRNALVLGLLTAVGPFAIDMYLPALPSIARSLGAGTGAVQMSLMAFLVTMGLGQLVYGPIADVLGRKPPLYFGLVLFVVASVGCSLAPDIRTLSRPWRASLAWPSSRSSACSSTGRRAR